MPECEVLTHAAMQINLKWSGNEPLKRCLRMIWCDSDWMRLRLIGINSGFSTEKSVRCRHWGVLAAAPCPKTKNPPQQDSSFIFLFDLKSVCWWHRWYDSFQKPASKWCYHLVWLWPLKQCAIVSNRTASNKHQTIIPASVPSGKVEGHAKCHQQQGILWLSFRSSRRNSQVVLMAIINTIAV